MVNLTMSLVSGLSPRYTHSSPTTTSTSALSLVLVSRLQIFVSAAIMPPAMFLV